MAAIVAHKDGMVKFSVAGKTVSETNVRIVNNGVDTSSWMTFYRNSVNVTYFTAVSVKTNFRRVCSGIGIRYQTKSLIERTTQATHARVLCLKNANFCTNAHELQKLRKEMC